MAVTCFPVMFRAKLGWRVGEGTSRRGTHRSFASLKKKKTPKKHLNYILSISTSLSLCTCADEYVFFT